MPRGRRLAAQVRSRALRVRGSALPIAQCAVAAGLAWYVAGDLVGHTRPFFAPIAAVISLGVSLTSRVRRAAELAVGVSVGILVGDLLIARIGTGAWQIALVVALALTVAVFAEGPPCPWRRPGRRRCWWPPCCRRGSRAASPAGSAR